jgi:hypothetical protein
MAEVVITHEYGGDVGENPAAPPVENKVVMAGLASASAAPGQAEVEDTDSGLD